jgi:hypothetical protein
LERAAEWFALVTCLVAGLSHVLRPRDWADAYARLHRLGPPGAFINGAVSLFPGAAFVAAHPVWTGPRMALTLFGSALILKGTIAFLAPGAALRSMGKAGTGEGRVFRPAGVALLLFAAFLGYLLRTR